MTKINKFLDKPLNKFIFWFIIGLLIIIVGIFPVKADTITYKDFTAQLFDNNNASLSYVTTNYTNGSYRGTIPYMGANSSGASWGISSGKPLLANHTYSLTIQITGPYGGRLVLSSYNRIGVGSSLSSAMSSYSNNSYVVENYSNANGDNGVFQFAFTPSINGSYIVFPFSVNSSLSNQEYWIDSFIIDDLGSSGVSETTINNSLNNQTNIINGSIQSSTNNIQSSIHTTEENIINNQNENQEKTNDLLGNCKKNLINLNNVNTSDSNSGYRYPVSLTAGKTYTIMSYDNLFNFKIGESRWSYTDNEGNSSSIRYTFTYTPNSNNTQHYLMVYYQQPPGANLSTHQLVLVEGNYSGPFINYNEQVCSSKLDDTNQAINDVNDSLNDDTAPDTPDFSDLDVADDSVISDLVTMPITIAEHILDAFNDTCSNYTIPFFNNTTLTLPCFTIGDYVGDNVASVIDLAIILFMIYNIAMLAISAFNDLTSLRDSYDSLYVPQHGPHSYQPRHGKE